MIPLKNLQEKQMKLLQKGQVKKQPKKPGDLIGNKITNKNTSISKTSPKDLHSQNEDEIKIL